MSGNKGFTYNTTYDILTEQGYFIYWFFDMGVMTFFNSKEDFFASERDGEDELREYIKKKYNEPDIHSCGVLTQQYREDFQMDYIMLDGKEFP